MTEIEEFRQKVLDRVWCMIREAIKSDHLVAVSYLDPLRESIDNILIDDAEPKVVWHGRDEKPECKRIEKCKGLALSPYKPILSENLIMLKTKINELIDAINEMRERK